MNINISKVKIVVMVPRNYTDNLRELICKTKAGVIGNYTDCSVSTNVIGTFKPNDKANPTIGKKRKLEKVKETVAEALGADIDTITAETSFKEDLGADSLDLFEMVMSLEDTCGVEIPTEDLETMVTVGDVAEYLEQHKN